MPATTRYLLEASYKLAQNMLLNLVYTSQSGDYWDASQYGRNRQQANLHQPGNDILISGCLSCGLRIGCCKMTGEPRLPCFFA